MVRSDPVPTGTGVIAALDAVAKPKANAAPRTIVLIINRSLIVVDSPARPPIRKPAGAKLAIEHDKNNDSNYRFARFHLDERSHLDERPAATAPCSFSENRIML
jgi:hypothetical protein